jgi:hypothetical protein
MDACDNQSMDCHVNDALLHMNQAEYRAHYIIIYPDLHILRQLYASYIQEQIVEKNEIILVNPFYETIDSVRQILSESNPGLDVSKHEREKSLIVIDSLEEYFDKQPDMPCYHKALNILL